MKITGYTLSLFLAAGANAGYTCNYVPTEDVVDHSKSAIDVSKVTDLVVADDKAGALTYYTSQTARSSDSKTLENTAKKDWAASGAPDDIYQNYVSILGADFLDSYNKDSIQCTGAFAGKSAGMCATAAKKNVMCTTLAYGLYEVAKSGGPEGTEKNWDEGFAFWNGLFEEELDGVGLGKYAGGAIQDSRDGNFETSNKMTSCNGFKNGQGQSKDQKNTQIGTIAQGLVATFSQAVLKYSAEMVADDTEEGKRDAKWAEGYTYFRCAAGLFDSDFAAYVETEFSPLTNEFPTGQEMYCKLATKMHETTDLGFGVNLKDLGTSSFGATQNIASDCNLEGELGGDSSSNSSGGGSSGGGSSGSSSDDSGSSSLTAAVATGASLTGAAVAYLI